MTTPMRRTVAATIAAALFALPVAAEPLAMRARAFDGHRWHDALTVEIGAGGRIVRTSSAGGVATTPTPAGSVLTPGLLDLDARWGLAGGDAETHEALSPDLLLADAFAPDDDEPASFLRSGVTTAWLGGAPDVVLAGAGALVEPAADGAHARARRWGACGSLASPARDPEREPSSPPDQARAFASAASSIPGPARIRHDDGASARWAASLGIPVGLPSKPEDLVELESAPRLILSADWSQVSVGDLAGVLPRLARGGIAFGSGASPAGSSALRLAASRCVAEGATSETVLRALTSEAARMIDDPARGRLEAGAIADMVLWSGDPTSLASRPLIIWVGGREVYRAN